MHGDKMMLWSRSGKLTSPGTCHGQSCFMMGRLSLRGQALACNALMLINFSGFWLGCIAQMILQKHVSSYMWIPIASSLAMTAASICLGCTIVIRGPVGAWMVAMLLRLQNRLVRFPKFGQWPGLLLASRRGDANVVNCVVGHPHQALLASCGIDATVKLWRPRASRVPFLLPLHTSCAPNRASSLL